MNIEVFRLVKNLQSTNRNEVMGKVKQSGWGGGWGFGGEGGAVGMGSVTKQRGWVGEGVIILYTSIHQYKC